MSVWVTWHVEVKTSPIHGRGVFAKEDIEEGSYIGNYEGVPAGPGQSKFDFYDPESGETRRGRNELRYMNANDEDPNCDFEGYDCFALRDIAAGEELTFDYEWNIKDY